MPRLVEGSSPWCSGDRAIRDWPDHAPQRATRLLHGRLSRLPCTTINALRDAVGDWLRDRFPNAAGDDKVLAYDVFDHVVGCLLAGGSAATESAVGEQTVGGEPIQGSRQTFMHAINGPIGKAVEGLLKKFGNGNPAQGSALPADLEARLDRLLATPGEGSGHAVCVLSTRIAWLHHLDSAWVAAKMISWFHLDHHRSEPAWSGILWNPWGRIQPVFGAIKASFLALPTGMYTWASREETEQYCCWVVAASLLAGDDGPGLSFKEVRQCLRQINPEGRQRVIWFLAQVGAGNDDGWQELVIPFIRKAWPNEHRYQTGETTEAWLSLLEDTEDSFPKVLAAVRGPPSSRQLGAARAVRVPSRGRGERAADDQVSARDTGPTGPCRAVGFAGCTVRADGCAWTACRGGTRSDRGHTVHEAPRAGGSALTFLRPLGAFLGRCRSGSVRIVVTEWRRDGEQAVMRQSLSGPPHSSQPQGGSGCARGRGTTRGTPNARIRRRRRRSDRSATSSAVY